MFLARQFSLAGIFWIKKKMMMRVGKWALGLLMFFSVSLSAQKGIVRGTIIDDETGEPLFSASVVAKGTMVGEVTDFDGKYELKLDPGVYDIQASFIGYNTINIEGVEVKADDVNVLNNLRLAPSSAQLEEAVVTAEVLRNTESALLTVKKKSANVMDGISAQNFRKIGDSDAASAAKRVSGVSVEGGKYVYVRGLGDRYTKTILNGMEVPGLDPDRNALQMDIFPTSIIENMVVLKSFTADLPADFTGGIVNIETRSFPSKKIFSASLGLGYTPGMHFNDEYLSYDGGSTDFLGFDDGTRSLPVDRTTAVPDPASVRPGDAQQLEDITRSFNPTLAAMEQTSFMNVSAGVSGGNQYKLEGKTVGWSGALSYKNNTDYYDDWQQNFWQKPYSASEFELRPDVVNQGRLGINNVLLSGMLGGAMKMRNSKYVLNVLHIQNGEKKAGYFDRQQFIGNPGQYYRDNLEYSQRSLTNVLVSGEHVNDDASWTLEWKVAPTISAINDKDVRKTPFEFDNGIFKYAPSTAEEPERIWRELDEINIPVRVDAIRDHKVYGKSSKMKFGVGGTFKQRDFTILNYFMKIDNYDPRRIEITGDANDLMDPDMIWTAARDTGTYIDYNFIPSNSYNSYSTNFAGYISEEVEFSTRWKAIAGIRAEMFDLYYSGEDQSGNVYDNAQFINKLDLFPTASVIFTMDESTNLRGSYSRTTARPSFKEASAAQIEDVLTGITFIGNPDIRPTYINNMDLRIERFMEGAQIISASAFYKTFDDPIEIVSFAAAPDNVQPRNLGDAEVFGFEAELRKNFDFISPSLSKIMFIANASWIESRLRFGQEQKNAREFAAREGEDIGDYRPLQGQAPYLMNAGLSYSDLESGLETGVYYNVQGPKLAIVGISQTPDVYTEPFHSLNFKFMKAFGADKNYELSLSVDNILNDKREMFAESYGSADQLYSRYNPGTTLSLGFRYSL